MKWTQEADHKVIKYNDFDENEVIFYDFMVSLASSFCKPKSSFKPTVIEFYHGVELLGPHLFGFYEIKNLKKILRAKELWRWVLKKIWYPLPSGMKIIKNRKNNLIFLYVRQKSGGAVTHPAPPLTPSLLTIRCQSLKYENGF